MMAPLRPPLALVIGFALCACATARKDLGEVDVKSNPPLTSSQLITSYGFHLEEGRIFLTRPDSRAGFDFSFESAANAGPEAGCLRGILAQRLHEYCPRASLPDDEPGTVRWRDTNSTTTFTARLSPDGTTIEVESGLNRGAFAVGAGAAADELRRHPALLGLAFAYGLLPRANGTAEEGTRDFKYVVAQRAEVAK
jgi:hypothetical protein